jgi:hypothetical protein
VRLTFEVTKFHVGDPWVYSLIALRHGIARARATLAWADEAQAELGSRSEPRS